MRRSLRACLPKKKTSQVVTINSGALIAGLSQIKNHDFVPPAVIGSALLIWAVGVTSGVATWGAAFNAVVVAQAAADRETQLRWRRIGAVLFHTSLAMFLAVLLVMGLAALLWPREAALVSHFRQSPAIRAAPGSLRGAPPYRCAKCSRPKACRHREDQGQPRAASVAKPGRRGQPRADRIERGHC